jgi:hypothetical protein
LKKKVSNTEKLATELPPHVKAKEKKTTEPECRLGSAGGRGKIGSSEPWEVGAAIPNIPWLSQVVLKLIKSNGQLRLAFASSV